MSDLQARVFKLISEKLDVPLEKVTLQSSFTDDFKTSSLDLVDLIMNFEEEFSIEIPDDDASRIRTVADAVKYLSQRVS